jgi:hypothetical protein
MQDSHDRGCTRDGTFSVIGAVLLPSGAALFTRASPDWPYGEDDRTDPAVTISHPPAALLRVVNPVPYYLRHLFWNTATSQLNVTTSAPFIAKRLLSTGDLDGLAWGATHLPPEAWESPRCHQMRLF